MEKRGSAPDIFLKPFDPAGAEARISALWEQGDYANPDTCIAKGVTEKDAESYSIVLPPPNVTGTLHMGHAAMLAIEDILIRTARMQGKKTLWIPGADSAAIATQSKVEGEIYKKEKLTRYDLGREELLKRIEIFTDESKSTIINQVKRMGSSLDWSRYAYTLDEKRYGAVMEAFVRMYDAGLIYRGDRIVNWDPKLQTTVSDDEIEYVEQKDSLYYLQYGPFVIATARPETKFGDKYVVMHPDDARYAEYQHGQTIEDIEWINGKISATVIKDDSIDMAFGTGVMTITPAHDAHDFELARKHKLPSERVIDDKGLLLPIAAEFAGTHIKKARPLIVEKLTTKGLVTKVEENYVHNVATNSRGGGVIEPQIKLQWFIDVNKSVQFPDGSTATLKQKMREVVENASVKIMPERYERVYYHWIDNLRDWNVSRQIWFGHRIPAWFKRELGGPHQAKHFNAEILLEKLNLTEDEFRITASNTWQPLPDLPDYARSGGSPNIQIGKKLLSILKEKNLIDDTWIGKNEIKQSVFKDEEVYVGIKAPEGPGWVQDEDVLDTWFSSGLWTFSTLGWPEKTDDLKTYHPTAVLETGYDILFFWVARMILMSTFLVGEIPFKNVYLHGLVRDGKGQKMSKSLGNIIDPLVMIEKYGADATRLSLIMGSAPGTDLKLSEDKVRGFKHFANKLWNISRFVLENMDDANTRSPLLPEDKKLLDEARELAKEVSENIAKFRLDLAADLTYHFVWDRFAAQMLEEAKPVFKDGSPEAKSSRQQVLYEILIISLKLLHPFMPFVTEAIWQELPVKESDQIMVAKWPTLVK